MDVTRKVNGYVSGTRSNRNKNGPRTCMSFFLLRVLHYGLSQPSSYTQHFRLIDFSFPLFCTCCGARKPLAPDFPSLASWLPTSSYCLHRKSLLLVCLLAIIVLHPMICLISPVRGWRIANIQPPEESESRLQALDDSIRCFSLTRSFETKEVQIH